MDLEERPATLKARRVSSVFVSGTSGPEEVKEESQSPMETDAEEDDYSILEKEREVG